MIRKLSPEDQLVVLSPETELLEVYDALPPGLLPPFPPVELPGGVGGLVLQGGFGQTFFFPSEVLGLTLLTHRGRLLRLGGEVVKNVQGYDLIRPVVGSFGYLGELRELIVRLRPARSYALFRLPGRLEEAPKARFLFELEGELYALAAGHPKEVEAFGQRFGGALSPPLDLRSQFPEGIGPGPGPLRDLRYRWANGGSPPPPPPHFAALAEVL